MAMQHMELEYTCGHGVTINKPLKLPLTVEVLDCSEMEDESLWIVWVVSKTGADDDIHDWYLTTLCEPTSCKLHADLVAQAFQSLLATPSGVKEVIEFIQHRLSNDDCGAGADDEEPKFRSVRVTAELEVPVDFSGFDVDKDEFRPGDLQQDLVGEAIAVKSGVYDNAAWGHITSVVAVDAEGLQNTTDEEI